MQQEVPLAVPDILVCSVGTEIFYEAGSAETPEADNKWITKLDQGWDRARVVEIASQHDGLTLQGHSEQRPHKVSYRVSLKGEAAIASIQALQESLRKQGLSAKVIYSGGEDLDILPAQASKGKGLEFLLQELKEQVGAPEEGVLVNGDSGNDIELFQVPGVKGTMVSNAHPELKDWVAKNPSADIFKASRRCAGGILEAMQHFDLIKKQSSS